MDRDERRYLARNEALDRKGEQDGAAEHDSSEIHQIVVPAVILHEVALNIGREGRVAGDPEGRGDQEGREKGPVRYHVPLLLGRSLDRAVNQEGIVMAHEGECHYTNGRNDPREISESPAVLLTRAVINHVYDYT